MNKGGHPDTAHIKITKNYILKTYNKEYHSAYVNELHYYILAKKKKLNYIPELIDYDPIKLTFKIKNVGVALDEYCSNNELDIDTFLPKIKNIYNKFISLGFYHNDLRYKNIIINPISKKLYLIDFEYTGIKYTDNDDQNIVKKISGNKGSKKTFKK